LRAGQLDAFFWSGGLPTPGIRELARTTTIRLVPLGEAVNPLRASYGAVYRRATVSSTTYEGEPQTVTVAVPNYLVVSADLDDQLVYELTRVLFRHRGTIGAKVPSGRLLDARSAISTMPVLLHAGAERYYADNKP
jgi:TRAP transporter TAXI family solute receptor